MGLTKYTSKKLNDFFFKKSAISIAINVVIPLMSAKLC